MKGFRVEGQQLGAAQIETLAHPGECGHATKFFHSLNSQNTHEDLGFGGPIPVTVGTCDTKVTTFTRIPGDTIGGEYRHARRDQKCSDCLLTALSCCFRRQGVLGLYPGDPHAVPHFWRAARLKLSEK